MIDKPRDRAAQAQAVVEAVDGTMEAIYWTFGPHDGLCIFDAPSQISAAAVSVAVGSTGSFKQLETHELLTQEQLTHTLESAREVQAPLSTAPSVSHRFIADAFVLSPLVHADDIPSAAARHSPPWRALRGPLGWDATDDERPCRSHGKRKRSADDEDGARLRARRGLRTR